MSITKGIITMSTEKWHVTMEEATKLTDNPIDPGWCEVMVRGTMLTGFYKPNKIDDQTPHAQDEVYFVCCGSGTFINGGDIVKVKTADFLFVPAFAEHRFEDFSGNFAVWVVFYGKNAGKTSKIFPPNKAINLIALRCA